MSAAREMVAGDIYPMDFWSSVRRFHSALEAAYPNARFELKPYGLEVGGGSWQTFDMRPQSSGGSDAAG